MFLARRETLKYKTVKYIIYPRKQVLMQLIIMLFFKAFKDNGPYECIRRFASLQNGTELRKIIEMREISLCLEAYHYSISNIMPFILNCFSVFLILEHKFY